ATVAAAVTTAMQVAALAYVWWRFAARSTPSVAAFGEACFAALVVFVALGKVLVPPFLVWLLAGGGVVCGGRVLAGVGVVGGGGGGWRCWRWRARCRAAGPGAATGGSCSTSTVSRRGSCWRATSCSSGCSRCSSIPLLGSHRRDRRSAAACRVAVDERALEPDA